MFCSLLVLMIRQSVRALAQVEAVFALHLWIGCEVFPLYFFSYPIDLPPFYGPGAMLVNQVF